MPAFFSDSSALVKSYVSETGSTWMRALLDPAAGNLHYTCRITAAEVAAAIGRRIFEGSISPIDGRQAIVDLRRDFGGYYQIVEVAASLIDHAIDLTQQHRLRAYDAVQLASALSVAGEHIATGLAAPTFLCADARLRAAAAAEGLASDDPNAHP